MRIFLTLIAVLIWQCLSAQTKPALPDTLRVGYKLAPPFVQEEGEVLGGPSIWLWKQIADELDLPYTMVRLPLGQLLDSLSAGSIDLCASPLTITSERSEHMEFTPPYFIEHATILTHRVSTVRRALDFMRSFFSLNFFRLLGALCVVILLFGLLVWLFERKANPEQFGHGIKGLWHGFWWSAVTMTTVGYGDKAPKTTGGRIVAFIWMFSAILLISGFTASFASALTLNRMGASRESVDQLKGQTLGTLADSGTEEWLAQNFFPNRRTYAEMPQLIAALERGEIDAIAYDRSILQSVVRSDSTDRFRLMDLQFNPEFYAVGMRRGLPESIRKTISMAVLERTESMDWKVLLSEYHLKQ